MRNIFGLVIVILGLGLLLQQYDVPHAKYLVDTWWPILIMIVGALAWVKNRRQWFGPFLIFLVGAMLLVDQLQLTEKSAWNLFWPIIVIVIGARILIGRQPKGADQECCASDAQAVFSGIDRRVTGPYTGGNASAWFGGVKLDLREAQFTSSSTLNVSAGFGGIDVFVPKSVRVVSNVTAILGGADDKSSPDGSAAHTLTVTGFVIFGGVTVKN